MSLLNVKTSLRGPVLALALSTLAASASLAQTNADTSGTILQGVYDKAFATKASVYCQITVTTTATLLSSLLSTASCAAIPSTATMAFVEPELSSTSVLVRFRADGTAPTAAIGFPILGYQAWPVLGQLSLTGLSLISATGSSVIVDVLIQG